MNDKILNRKVEISEKLYKVASSTFKQFNKYNTLVGIVPNIYNNKFIEMDGKTLVAIDYIYKIDIILEVLL